jgi:phytanoyl-CoA hydroxylase
MAGLDRRQADAFREDGYLVVNEAFSPGDLDPLIVEFEASVEANANEAQRQGLITETFSGEPFPTRLARIVASAPDPSAADAPASILYRNLQGKLKSPAMFGVLTHPALLDIVESLIGPEILAHPQFNVRAKLPAQDRGVVPWHQDLGYLEAEAEQTFMVNFWIPLVDATKENGCLEVISGSHLHSLVDHAHGLGPAGNFKGIPTEALPPGDPVLCPVPKGGVLLIQHKTIHRSLTNASDHVRWSLDLRYSDPDRPTGRDDVPGFMARSRKHPERVARSLGDWLALFAVRADQVFRRSSVTSE